jgi:RHS repeat-associated protein
MAAQLHTKLLASPQRILKFSGHLVELFRILMDCDQETFGCCLHVTQTTGRGYPFQYRYDLSGALIQEAYPSGRTVMNGYDAAGRLCSVSGTTASSAPAPPYACSGSGNSIYAGYVQYAAHGSLKTLARGDTLTETWSYNARIQPQSVNVGAAFGLNLYYCTGKGLTCSSNNGDLVTAAPATPGLDQVAGYDGVNRLSSFQEGPNYQNYAYDPNSGYTPAGSGWGNRFVSLNSGVLPLSGFIPGTPSGYNAQNQLSAAQYGDGRGNMTSLGAWTFSYDGENRLAAVQTAVGQATYGYDGSGKRVTKTWGAQTTTYVYDAMEKLAAEYGYSPSTPCTTCYVSVDQLGSTRVLTDAQWNVKERHDYMPFGDELLAGVGGRTTAQGYPPAGGTSAINTLFTGHYRDIELANSQMPSGLDFFGARHMSSAQGRFMSPDPDNFDARLGLPQSWNMYGYTINNPLKYTDNDGRFFNLGTAAAGAVVGATVNVASYAITQYATGQSFQWGTAGKLAAVGAGTGALAGFTFGASLAANAIDSVAVGTTANIINGAASRAIKGEKAFDDNKITSDFETGLIGSTAGATVYIVGTAAAMGLRPAAPSPLATVRSQLRHLAKLRAWEKNREKLDVNFARIGAVTGGLLGGAIDLQMGNQTQNGFASVSSSWQSLWTFGCACIPDVESTIYF